MPFANSAKSLQNFKPLNSLAGLLHLSKFLVQSYDYPKKLRFCKSLILTFNNYHQIHPHQSIPGLRIL